MTCNLVIWNWGSDYETQYSRRKRKLRNTDVARALLTSETHFAVGEFDQALLIQAIEKLYPEPKEGRPFVIEQYSRHVVVNVPLQSRIEVVSSIGRLAMRLGLNGCEA
jgi:hypothetical protein